MSKREFKNLVRDLRRAMEKGIIRDRLLFDLESAILNCSLQGLRMNKLRAIRAAILDMIGENWLKYYKTV